MKKCILAAAALTAGSLFAGNGTWVYRAGIGTTPTNAADWTDSANWKDGIVATGSTAVANLAVGSGTVWVRIPDNFVVNRIDANSDSTLKLRLICDGTLRLTDGGRIRGAQNNRPNVWADLISVDGLFNPFYSDFSSPMKMTKGLYWGPSGGALRLDYFATSTDPVVSGVITLGEGYANSVHQVDLYSRKVVTATIGTWDTVAGQRIVKWRVGGKGTTLSPGQTIHAPGVFPEGTFLKRVYGDSYIEFSKPALETHAEGVEIAFDAFSPRVEETIPLYDTDGDGGTGFLCRRQTASDVLDVTFEKFVASDNRLQLYATSADAAGRTIFKDTTGARKGVISRGWSHIVLTATNETGLCGLNGLTFTKIPTGKYGTATVEIGEGLDATIHEVTTADTTISGTPTVQKIGAGWLTVKSTQAHLYAFAVTGGQFLYAPQVAGATLDSLSASGTGTFRLADGAELTVAAATVSAGGTLVWPADATLNVTKLTLASAGGAIIHVEEGATFDATGRTIPKGTIFEGKGAVTGLVNADLKKFVFRGGIHVTATGAKSAISFNGLSADLPTRISPAFWVSAKSSASMIKGNPNRSGLITQWNDCRGTPAEGYHFATNTMADGFPFTSSGKQYYAPCQFDSGVIMRKVGAVTTIGESPALVWDKPITGIKAVFSITRGYFDANNGCGSILGSSPRLSSCDFARDNVNSWYNERFSSSKASVNVYNAPYYINGRLPPDGQTLGGSVRAHPTLNGCYLQLVEVHPLGEGAEADCWGFQNAIPGMYGAFVGECMIYTNEVTEIERRQIENYLIKKWFGGSVVGGDVIPPAQDLTGVGLEGAELVIAQDDAVVMNAYTNESGFVKSGAGELFLRGVQTTGSLKVAGGTVTLTSCDARKQENLPEGAIVHLDANNDESFPGAVATDGGQKIDTWRDTRDAARVPYLCRPYVNSKNADRIVEPEAFAQPMKVVDYGPLKTEKDEGASKEGSGWWFTADQCSAQTFTRDGNSITNVSGIKAAFSVWGTKYGGNQMLGGWGDGKGGGLVRAQGNSADVAANIAKPIMDGADGQHSASQSNIGYNSLAFLNGEEVVPVNAHPSGTYDVISILSPYPLECSSLGGYGNRSKINGLQVGEMLLYTRQIGEDEARAVDAYLNWKWFGRTPPPRFRPATLGALVVDAGATLTVDGNAPVTVGRISGAGTVNGAVTLAENAVFAVPVEADGKITQTLTVSGALDLSKGGTVQLTGDSVGNLKAGKYRLIASAQLGAVGSWTVTGYAGRKILKLKADASGLWLEVVNCGLVLFVH